MSQSRSVKDSSVEHWAEIGQIMEENPDLPYEFVKQALIAKAEREAGKLEPYDFG